MVGQQLCCTLHVSKAGNVWVILSAPARNVVTSLENLKEMVRTSPGSL